MSTLDKNAFKEEIERLEPTITRWRRQTTRMNIFNFAAAMAPTLSVGIPLVFRRPDLMPLTCVAGAFLAAATTQIARWQKASLVNEFESLWNKTAAGDIRTLTLGFLRECIDKRISKDKTVVGPGDLKLREPHTAIPLAGTFFTAIAYTPIAPVVFFSGTAMREFRDNMHLDNTLRSTQHYHAHMRATL